MKNDSPEQTKETSMGQQYRQCDGCGKFTATIEAADPCKHTHCNDCMKNAQSKIWESEYDEYEQNFKNEYGRDDFIRDNWPY